MKRDLFKLNRFKMKDNQDVELGYRYDGKKYEKVTFSRPVHPDLATKYNSLVDVFSKITGIVAEPPTSAVSDIEMRGLHIFDNGEANSFMLNAVLEFAGGVKGNVNTPRYSESMYNDLFRKGTDDINIETLLAEIENEVFELASNHKTAQGSLFTPEEQGAGSDE